MYDVKLLVGNSEVAASDARTFTRQNPFTNEVVTRAAAATVSDAAAAAESAAGAFPAWSALGPGARRGKLLSAADILEQRAQDVAARMAAETGSTPAWAQLNVHLGRGCYGKPRP